MAYWRMRCVIYDPLRLSQLKNWSIPFRLVNIRRVINLTNLPKFPSTSQTLFISQTISFAASQSILITCTRSKSLNNRQIANIPWHTPIYESAPPCAIRVKAMASSQSKICYQSAIAQFLNQKMDFSIT